mgnify:CR=1 FL=1
MSVSVQTDTKRETSSQGGFERVRREGEKCTKNERKNRDREKLRGNSLLFPPFHAPWVGVYIVQDQDSTKSQMGVVTPTYPCLSHLYTCTQKTKCACVHSSSHITRFMFTHHTLTLPYTYMGNKNTSPYGIKSDACKK